jgi:YbbR domain-containing protein
MKWLTYNFQIKLVCLLLSIGLWYALKVEETSTITIKVFVQPKLNPGMVLVRNEPSQLEITLSGRKRDLSSLREKSSRLRISLQKIRQAKVLSKTISPKDFNFGHQIKIIRIEPQEITFELDRLVEKVLPIKALHDKMVAPNYDLKNIHLNPSSINIKGPEKVLARLNFLFSEKIHLQGVKTTFFQKIKLQSPFPGFSNTEEIEAWVVIERSKEERFFENIPVKILKSKGDFNDSRLKTFEVTLNIQASRSDFDGVKKEDFITFVDVSDLKTGTYELPVHLVKKDRYKLIEIKPKSVEVMITERL